MPTQESHAVTIIASIRDERGSPIAWDIKFDTRVIGRINKTGICKYRAWDANDDEVISHAAQLRVFFPSLPDAYLAILTANSRFLNLPKKI